MIKRVLKKAIFFLFEEIYLFKQLIHFNSEPEPIKNNLMKIM